MPLSELQERVQERGEREEQARNHRNEQRRRQRAREQAVGRQRAGAEEFSYYIEGSSYHSNTREEEIEWCLNHSPSEIRAYIPLVDKERENMYIELIKNTPRHNGDDEYERQWYRNRIASRDTNLIYDVIVDVVRRKVDHMARQFEILIRDTPGHSGNAQHEIDWFIDQVSNGHFLKIASFIPMRIKPPNPFSLLKADKTGCQPYERYISPLPSWMEDHIPFVPILGHCEVSQELREYRERLDRYETGGRHPGEPPRRIDELSDPF